MNEASIFKQLARHHFTSQLPDSVQAALASIGVERRFASGDVLCREGEDASELYLLAGGHVALEMLVPGRGQVRVLTLGPGEVLAWSALVGKFGATATGIATDEVRAVVLPADLLWNLCESNHEVGYFVMRELARAVSRRLVETRLQLLDLFHEQSSSPNRG